MTPAERQKRWRENNREKDLQGQRNRYANRRKKGLCNQCNKPSGSLSVCRECLDKRKKPKGGVRG